MEIDRRVDTPKTINFASKAFFKEVGLYLLDNPDKKVEAYLEDSVPDLDYGNFSIGLVKKKGKIFVQADNFDRDELIYEFIQRTRNRWKSKEGGRVFVVDVTKILTGNIDISKIPEIAK